MQVWYVRKNNAQHIQAVCAGTLDLYQREQVLLSSPPVLVVAEVPRVSSKALADEMRMRAVALTGEHEDF